MYAEKFQSREIVFCILRSLLDILKKIGLGAFFAKINI